MPPVLFSRRWQSAATVAEAEAAAEAAAHAEEVSNLRSAVLSAAKGEDIGDIGPEMKQNDRLAGGFRVYAAGPRFGAEAVIDGAKVELTAGSAAGLHQAVARYMAEHARRA